MSTQSDLEMSLGFLLVDVARLFRSNFEKFIELAGFDVTPGEARILAYISKLGKCRQSKLASLLSFEQMTVSSYVDRLVLNNLVSRISDPIDRRAKIVEVTSEGEALLREIEAVVQSLHESAFMGICSFDVDVTSSTLETMRVNILETLSRYDALTSGKP